MWQEQGGKRIVEIADSRPSPGHSLLSQTQSHSHWLSQYTTVDTPQSLTESLSQSLSLVSHTGLSEWLTVSLSRLSLSHSQSITHVTRHCEVNVNFNQWLNFKIQSIINESECGNSFQSMSHWHSDSLTEWLIEIDMTLTVTVTLTDRLSEWTTGSVMSEWKLRWRK